MPKDQAPREQDRVCILWHPRGTEPPADLLEVLGRRHVDVHRVSSPCLALAEVVRREGVSILLLSDPDRLDEPGRLMRAIDRYAPSTHAWVYEGGANRRLRGVVEEDIGRWVERDGGTNDLDEDDPALSDRLSADELSMLLGEDG